MVVSICADRGMPDAVKYVCQCRLMVTAMMLADIPADITAEAVLTEYDDDHELRADPSARDLRASARTIQRMWLIFRIPAPDPNIDELDEAEHAARIANLLERHQVGPARLIVARQRKRLAETAGLSDEDVFRELADLSGAH